MRWCRAVVGVIAFLLASACVEQSECALERTCDLCTMRGTCAWCFETGMCQDADSVCSGDVAYRPEQCEGEAHLEESRADETPPASDELWPSAP